MRDPPWLASYSGTSHRRRCLSRDSISRMIRRQTAAAVWPVAAAVLVVSVGAQQPHVYRVNPETIGLSSARLDEATALLNRYVAEKRIAGAVAAVARLWSAIILRARFLVSSGLHQSIFVVQAAQNRRRPDAVPAGEMMPRRPRPV
jgi:hypothetical protein